MARQLLSLVMLSALCLCWATEILPHLRSIDDSIGYRINYLPRTAFPGALDDERMMPIVSVDNEPYLCDLPEVLPEPIDSETFPNATKPLKLPEIPRIRAYAFQTKNAKISSYSGPSPAELIAPLHEDQCTYRSDGYWTYEICHGRYIRQFHEEKGGSVGLEYYMGYYRGEDVAKEARLFDELNPPKKKIDDKESAYYPVVYRQGSLCDISGSPRVTTMNYVCWPNADDYIHSIRETASCVYEIFIYTKRLCSHPSFPAPVSSEHDINCYAQHEATEPQPKAVLRMAQDLKKSFHSDYKTRSIADIDEEGSDEDPTAFKVKFFDELDVDEYKEIIGMLDSLPDMEGLEKYKRDMVERIREKLKMEGNAKAAKTEGVNIAEIMATRCLQGGSGWWKYELCYGEKVTQFHEDKNGERVEIVLGYFDQKIHNAFIDQNPKKRPVVVNEKVTEVTHLYGGGDICESTNVHRSVEVRMRCRPNAGNLDISLFLLEPSTCQYVLGVDSPLLCGELQTADAYGMMSMDKDFSKHVEPEAPAEVKPAKAKFKKEVVAMIPGPAATSTPSTPKPEEPEEVREDSEDEEEEVRPKTEL